MDDNNPKSIPFKPMSTQDLSKLIKTQPQFSQQPIFKQQEMPKFERIQPQVIIKEEKEPKKGFEGFYEKHNGKITVGLTFIALVEAFWIFILSR